MKVTVRVPAVRRVIEKTPVPLVSGALAGSAAFVSVESNWMVSAKPVATLFWTSRAETVTLNGTPAVIDAGTPLKASDVAAPPWTVTPVELPTATPEIVAPSVTDPDLTPVKVAVYTPLPELATGPKVPEPGDAVEVKAICPSAGRPEGFRLP